MKLVGTKVKIDGTNQNRGTGREIQIKRLEIPVLPTQVAGMCMGP